jgi:uncharacterized membrane protein YgdD (TMEM256/DUF423 family)
MEMERTFLVLACVFGLVGVGLGAFGSHALRARLAPEQLARFEIAVRYQLWHALALFAVVLVGSVRSSATNTTTSPLVLFEGTMRWLASLAGWLFIAGIVLFSGSLHVLALTDARRWGAVTPVGGLCLLAGWAALALSALTA